MIVAKAVWKSVVLAESDDFVIVENNYYFPPGSINPEYFKKSDTHTTCHWKGVASYFDIDVNGEINKDAAWYYPVPNEKAIHIKDFVAFWRGIAITDK